MLEHLAEVYADFDVTRIVAVGESANSIRTYVDRSDYTWTVIDATSTSSLGETVHTAMDIFDTHNLRGRSVYVNFADTLISPLRAVVDESVVSYEVRDRTYRWTTFDIESERIVNVTDKNKCADNGPKPCFAGQFGLSDAKQFYKTLQETPTQSSADLDYLYRALLSYLDDSNYELHEPDSWLDVGHLDTYHRAKKRFLNAREFNDFKSHEKNIITKRSSDTETLINEINWYRNIPAELQPYLPRIYNSSTDSSDPYIKMEYIGYPSLSDIQLYGSHRQHIWDDVFHRIFNMYHEFQTFSADANEERINNALESIYIDKTRRRLARLRGENRFQPFFDADTICINGVEYPSVSEILNRLDEIIAESDLLTRETLSIIHGDLCLPNILYDPRNEILKLIDPRGKFGEFDIHGDPRYDLAKLRHSVVGHYEHLINDQFEATAVAADATLSYEIYTTSEQEHRENRFDMILTSKTEASIETIRLIESLLFLSMVPLHTDSFERQHCMLAQGIEKISPFLG
jgi:hypothetical protein